MENLSKEVICCRVHSATKDALLAKSTELNFKSLSEYLELILEKSLGNSNLSKFSEQDLNAIKISVSHELARNRRIPLPKDAELEKLLDDLMLKLVPKAAKTAFKTYSIENYSKEDLKLDLFEFIKKSALENNLELIRMIRRGLKK